MPNVPVLREGKPIFFFSLFVVLSIILTALAVSLGGVTRNQLLLVVVCFVITDCLIWYFSLKRITKSCTVQTNAVVTDVHTWGDETMLCVQYTVNGQLVENVLSYNEAKLPVEGQYVKVFYNPTDVYTCMMAVYKEKPVGFTKTGPKVYRSGRFAGFTLGVLFLLMGVALTSARLYLNTRLDGEATGVVVGYQDALDRPGNIELQPVVAFEYDGTRYIGLSYDTWYFQTLRVGQEVTVHFFTDDPTGVMITGNITFYVGVVAVFFFATLFIWSGVVSHKKLRMCDE